ncbi:LmbE family protein OS=Tsukamurella paurometabola (strain ATCC 8368 / DSM / CCUG 35730 / CIP 100753 / JCM 10117 / KCTC 9821 / NBRC 16120 / NCIMB 702349/ NCTC 13040) OX=521096 GN=Tpau_2063 PE=4 SV=1 [Tsukamurella paurometabola]|uniref:LmbE family protein n=1 Tax=Tsukamurella paurometabola (strain ATCC 8368 / DSM 20162 / CCUG 35730 / CIP 100753 / JCM 10117 / KCTC 9821 / NBRC 16120 / NCIMB 702349 / NCTC 13040) TaxID=521096 RepID=D5UNV7_TSUPD|nr:PIG-L family deacetylase [Tsukamurella paurometabola]ADG78675.1 LmbE family protein [Tsukamurella paurometabola DSM 20162]SUP32683.1 1D-myo-inositol 2-acetamido-2-deoxy-alpha-D-glucopyranoside deacetylase [Tsukamurella paurometabola]
MASVVALNAHPDDETILEGGTLAALAAAGHRVILVVATDGLVHDEPEPRRRLDELEAAAAALGVDDVRWLGYADSGHGAELYPDPPGRVRLVRAGVDQPAEQVAEILREVAADLLIGYDAAGGYGHRDHLAVHAIGQRAAELAGVRLVEATAPREVPVRLFTVASRLHLVSASDVGRARTWFTPSARITHRIDVRGHIAAKQRALAAHRTELEKPGPVARIQRLIVRLPPRLLVPLFGTEFFIEPGVAGRHRRLL